MVKQQQQQQQQRPMTLQDDGQRTPPATLLDTGERTPPLRASDQEVAEQEYQSQYNSTVPTSTPVRAPDNEGWDVESGAYRETQPEQEVVDEEGMIRPGYKNPSGDMQRS
ncbi:MAG: hypothetical protein CMI60_06330, partial [Parvibaculum sp.]|nr:hypothetical protein [Parvibaculum sp.]